MLWPVVAYLAAPCGTGQHHRVRERCLAEGEEVEPPRRLRARLGSGQVPSPIGLPFRRWSRGRDSNPVYRGMNPADHPDAYPAKTILSEGERRGRARSPVPGARALFPLLLAGVLEVVGVTCVRWTVESQEPGDRFVQRVPDDCDRSRERFENRLPLVRLDAATVGLCLHHAGEDDRAVGK